MSFSMDLQENVLFFGYTLGNDENAVLEFEGNYGKKTIAVKDISSILLDAGSWENAVAVHEWILNNVQSNTEDNSMIEICENDLLVLQDLCKQVLNDVTKSAELIPSPKYDLNYLIGIQDTLSVLDNLNLSEDTERYFIYRGGY